MSTVHLAARGVSFGFPGRQVLDAVDLTVGVGERLAVVGENGSGKSTLLRVLGGQLDASQGTVDHFGDLVLV
ncbi:MAG: ATP-binding cassette domain-containing protein, partial [Cellulomonadaceae bacterium]